MQDVNECLFFTDENDGGDSIPDDNEDNSYQENIGMNFISLSGLDTFLVNSSSMACQITWKFIDNT